VSTTATAATAATTAAAAAATANPPADRPHASASISGAKDHPVGQVCCPDAIIHPPEAVNAPHAVD